MGHFTRVLLTVICLANHCANAGPIEKAIHNLYTRIYHAEMIYAASRLRRYAYDYPEHLRYTALYYREQRSNQVITPITGAAASYPRDKTERYQTIVYPALVHALNDYLNEHLESDFLKTGAKSDEIASLLRAINAVQPDETSINPNPPYSDSLEKHFQRLVAEGKKRAKTSADYAAVSLAQIRHGKNLEDAKNQLDAEVKSFKKVFPLRQEISFLEEISNQAGFEFDPEFKNQSELIDAQRVLLALASRIQDDFPKSTNTPVVETVRENFLPGNSAMFKNRLANVVEASEHNPRNFQNRCFLAASKMRKP